LPALAPGRILAQPLALQPIEKAGLNLGVSIHASIR
jgi:hypothetical protein